MTYDDGYIELWGEVYRANRLLQGYCPFVQFLARPRYYLERVGHALLPEQLAVRRRIDHESRPTNHESRPSRRSA